MERYIKGEEVINNFTINGILRIYPELKTDYNDFLDIIKSKIDFYIEPIGTHAFNPTHIYDIDYCFKDIKNKLKDYFKKYNIVDYDTSVRFNYGDIFDIYINHIGRINIISKSNDKVLVHYVVFIQKCFLEYIPELRWKVRKI